MVAGFLDLLNLNIILRVRNKLYIVHLGIAMGSTYAAAAATAALLYSAARLYTYAQYTQGRMWKPLRPSSIGRFSLLSMLA
jgi:hypothetical protein